MTPEWLQDDEMIPDVFSSQPWSPTELSLQLSMRNLILIIGKNCQLWGDFMKDYHLIVIRVFKWLMSEQHCAEVFYFLLMKSD